MRASDAFGKLAGTPPRADVTTPESHGVTAPQGQLARYTVRLVDQAEEDALVALQRAVRKRNGRKPSYSELAAAAVVVAGGPLYEPYVEAIAHQIRTNPRRG